MALKKKHWLFSAVLLLAGGWAPATFAASIDFSGTSTNLFGATAGDAVNEIVHSQDGITMSVEPFTLNSFTDFNEARIDGRHANAFPSESLELDNISVLFDFTGVGFQVGQVTFEFMQLGGAIDLAVNGGNLLELDTLFDLPQNPTPLSPGIFALVEPGMVTLTGPVDSLLLGGQELLIDNIVATPVPEPATIGLFCAGLIVLACRRNRRHAHS